MMVVRVIEILFHSEIFTGMDLFGTARTDTQNLFQPLLGSRSHSLPLTREMKNFLLHVGFNLSLFDFI